MTDSKAISPGELAVGQFVTILQWLPREVIDMGNPFDMFSLGGTSTKIHQDRSWCGDVLRVEAVDLPYIAVSHPGETYLYGNTKLDTREVKLMELSDEYVKAMKRDSK